MDAGADVNATESEEMWTPLHFAAQYGQLDSCKFLISRGATICSSKGGYPIHLAAKLGSWELIKWLIEIGDDPRRIGPEGVTVLGRAALGGRVEIVKELLNLGLSPHPVDDACPPFIEVCEGGNMELFRMFVDLGVDINAKHDKKCTALHRACGAGHAEIANALLDLDAKLEVVRDPVLVPACMAGLLDVAKRLIALGMTLLPPYRTIIENRESKIEY